MNDTSSHMRPSLRWLNDQFGHGRAQWHVDALHRWADHLRRLGWTDATPGLMSNSGYTALFVRRPGLSGFCPTGPLIRWGERLVVDSPRWSRPGPFGPTAGLSTPLRRPPHRDWAILVRLAFKRSRLQSRYSSLPIDLVVLWAQFGKSRRAEGLAFSMPGQFYQAVPLPQLGVRLR